MLTDEAGRYYFPPLPTGKYRVWAQALSFETAKGEIDLGATKRRTSRSRPMEDFFRQLPGNVMLAALPEDDEQDKRMKRIVRNNCTACHTPSYVLQHRFDEAGWNAIIELMKNVNVYGIYRGRAGQADRHPRLSPEGARGLSREGARARRDQHEGEARAARRRAKRRASCSRNTTCRSIPTPACRRTSCRTTAATGRSARRR